MALGKFSLHAGVGEIRVSGYSVSCGLLHHRHAVPFGVAIFTLHWLLRLWTCHWQGRPSVHVRLFLPSYLDASPAFGNPLSELHDFLHRLAAGSDRDVDEAEVVRMIAPSAHARPDHANTRDRRREAMRTLPPSVCLLAL